MRFPLQPAPLKVVSLTLTEAFRQASRRIAMTHFRLSSRAAATFFVALLTIIGLASPAAASAPASGCRGNLTLNTARTVATLSQIACAGDNWVFWEARPELRSRAHTGTMILTDVGPWRRSGSSSSTARHALSTFIDHRAVQQRVFVV